MTLLTADAVAELLAVDRSTVYRWVDAQGLPAYRIGGVVRFREDEVMEWLSGQSVGSRAPRTPRTPAPASRANRLHAAVMRQVPESGTNRRTA